MQLRLFIATILTLFISGLSYAQTLSGKVTNSKNEPITSASVTIEGTNTGTTTNIEGRYSLSLSAGKKYTLSFSAIGYRTKVISDIDASNVQEELNVILEDSAKAMEGIVVRATSRRQENTTALLTFQKNNTAVSSVIAADFIRRTPDKNTGEVLKRVSGASIQDNKFVIIRGLADRYNSAYINGAQLPSSEPDKKAFSFDVIPSQLIDNIIINKTATPDLTGEFAGGLVQITTKDIPTQNMLSFGVSIGYNTLGSFKDFTSNPRGKNEWLGFSDRGLPSNYPKSAYEYNKLSLQEQIDVSRSFKDDVYRQVKSNSGPIQTYNLTWANSLKGENGGTFGSVIGITYRQSKLVYVNDNAVIRSFPGNFEFRDNQNRYSVNWGAVANFAYTKGKHKIAFKNLFNQLLDDNYYTRTGTQEENPLNLYSSVLNQRSLYTSQLEGSHGLFSDIKFNWNLNYSYNNKQQPDLRVQSYAVSPTDANDRLLNNRGNNTNRFFSDLADNSFGYSASITAPFNLFGNKQTLKVGGSGLARIRDFKSVILGYNNPIDASLLRLPFDQIFNKDNFREDGFRFITDLQNPSDKYYAVSALSAGYVMLDNKFSDKIRIIWGARVENFEQFLKSNQQSSERALLINTSKLDVLPSINFTFSPNTKTNLRLSGSKTVARPEFREIAPFAFFDFEQLASFSGNSTLKRSGIWNGDIRYELYPKAGELFSIGGFYKNFKDPIELTLDEGSSGTRRQYKFLNAQKASLLGAELEVRKSLSFLSDNQDWLSKLYFNGNITYIYSKVDFLSQRADEGVLSSDRPLQGQSPYLINAGFQYDGDQLGLSLLYNRIGPRLSLVGNRTFDNIFENARNLLDFQVSKKVLKNNGELRFTVSDVFNQKIMLFWDQDENYRYSSASDAVFSSYKPGTQFTLGFNYNFKL
jgi:hypothetical protein